MKRWLCLFPIALMIGSMPAHATGGLLCKTAGPRPIEVRLGFGHVPSASLFLARLVDDGHEVPLTASQWWMRKSELRLALVAKDAIREELILSARWAGTTRSYDGALWRSGRKRWVRCRED